MAPRENDRCPGEEEERQRRARRRECLWEQAREDAEMVLHTACNVNGVTVWPGPLFDADEADIEDRIKRVMENGRRAAYIGSTVDPAWRWKGGWCWRNEENRADDRAEWMIGHSHKWNRLVVLAAAPRGDIAGLETWAIHAGLRIGGQFLANKALDGRGFASRGPPLYGFIYICV